VIVRWLLGLYPRGWRDRYGAEVSALVANEPVTIRLILDLFAGAVDARLHPQPVFRRTPSAGQESFTMSTIFAHCTPVDVTRADAWRSAGLMIALSVVVAGVYIWLKRTLGENAFLDALAAAFFPIAALGSSWDTYLKPYSFAAKVSIVSATAFVVLLISLLASFLSEAI